MHRARSTPSSGRFSATAILVLLFLGSWLEIAPRAQSQNLSTYDPPEANREPVWDTTLLENEEPSGWLSVEMAILVDDRPETLNSEQWPARPTVAYPSRYRRLVVANELEHLAQRYPFSEITRQANGLVTIAMPEPDAFIASDKQQQLQRARARVAFDETLLQSEQANSSDKQGLPERESPTVLPLESLANTGRPSRPAIDNLTAYQSPTAALNTATQQPLPASPEPADTSIVAADDEPLLPPIAMTTPAEPPPLPTVFSQRPLTILGDGLRELRRTDGTEVAISAAWLQPPDVPNLPVIIDESGDLPNWPALQGFIELRRGDTVRLGVNFWLNTPGNYLPDNFYVTPPPKGPARIHVVDSGTGQPLNLLEVEHRQALLSHYQQERPMMQRALLAHLRALAAEERLIAEEQWPAQEQRQASTEPSTPVNAEQSELTTPSAPTLHSSMSDTSLIETGPEQTSIDLILAAFPTPLAYPPSDSVEDTEENVDENDEAGIEGKAANQDNPEGAGDWPYRHVIHVADTRVIPEATVRYFDHPVIQIVAAYRELSWGEVYQLGLAEFEANASKTPAQNADILDLPATALPDTTLLDTGVPETMVLPPAYLETR